MFADLHLHTHFSDGTYSPEQLAGEARRLGFKAVALTDHDTVEGCAPTAAACEKAGVEFIPASEITSEFDGNEIHLLGFFLDTRHPRLLSELSHYQEVRQQRIREMVGRLNAMKIPLKEETVFALANCRSPGRPHVARALVQQKICSSMDEAFDRFLKKNRPAWVPKYKVPAEGAIRLIHEAGGVAVMAHPGLNRADPIIPELVALGLNGLECFHTKHTPSMNEHYLKMAAGLGLAVTGGSDCHGMSKGKPLMGSVKLPYAFVEKLKALKGSTQSN